MPRCPGSKYTKSFYDRFNISKPSKHLLKKNIERYSENKLRRIILEEFGLKYDDIKNEYLERKRKGIYRLNRILYVDGLDSSHILFEGDAATLMYLNGKRMEFTISLT